MASSSPGFDDQDALVASSALLIVVSPDLTILTPAPRTSKRPTANGTPSSDGGFWRCSPSGPATPAPRTRRRCGLDRGRRPDSAARSSRAAPLRRPAPGGGFDERHWNLTSSPVFGPDGEVRAIVHHAEEVTAEVILKRREAAILESFTDAFFALDRDWRFTYVNAQAKALVGCRPGELIDTTIWETFPGVVGSRFETIYRRTADERASFSITEYYPDHDRWYESHTYPGASEGIAVYFRDVSDRTRAEKRLRENEERYRTLFESIDEGFCVIEMLFGADGEAEDFRYSRSTPRSKG